MEVEWGMGEGATDKKSEPERGYGRIYNPGMARRRVEPPVKESSGVELEKRGGMYDSERPQKALNGWEVNKRSVG
ncbi:hypothetical protein QE152_g13569 [Popillia japonica]|uniref:Uncharacterized protein n=1 Tax=Popillia japonica TaxID=7064 RepID=A0AAW1L9I0_POPJA